MKKPKRPETERWWNTHYFGAKGACKSLHQATVVEQVFYYYDWLYKKYPKIKRGIVLSVQKFNDALEEKYAVYRYDMKEVFDEEKQKMVKVIDFETKKLNNPAGYLFYWNPEDPETLRYCPRPACWRGKKKHKLHGCLIVFDDMSTILPADGWQSTPLWLRKLFSQARHFGIRTLSNAQDVFSVDINFRRQIDMCFRFSKIISSRDPDETRPPVKKVWGVYIRRRIKAELLWKFGNMSDDEIKAQKEAIKQQNKVNGTNIFMDVWKSTPHLITRYKTSIYDTTQDVPEFNPTGFTHTELYCIDPEHDHENKDAPNYCGYKKVIHELI